MEYSEPINKIEDLVNDAEALMRLLLYCNEASEAEDYERLRHIFNTTLYIAIDKVAAMREPIETFYNEGVRA